MKELRISHVILLLVALGVTSLWFFGRGQPIVVVHHSQAHQTTAVCATCVGGKEVVCTACAGFGRTEGVTCAACQGRGKRPCTACGGTGRTTRSWSTVLTTVRSNFSLWERCGSRLGIKPDPDSPPQRASDGSYPLIRKFAELKATPGTRWSLGPWGNLTRRQNQWRVTVVATTKTADGEQRQRYLFLVADREIVGMARAE